MPFHISDKIHATWIHFGGKSLQKQMKVKRLKFKQLKFINSKEKRYKPIEKLAKIVKRQFTDQI